MRLRWLALAAVSSLGAACAVAEMQPAAAPAPAAATEWASAADDRLLERSPVLDAPSVALTATAVSRRVPAFGWPGASRPLEVFRHPNEYGYEAVFLVKRTRGEWLQAYLPIRPNGSTGWLRARDVRISENPFSITVDLSSNSLTVRRGERVVMRELVAVGSDATPTPTGLFYTRMEHPTRDPLGAYGPYIQVLSAYSEVHRTFGGGNGEVGIHGTNDASSIGRDVSNGCIRMDNRAITRLTRLAPVGTPVRIRR